MAYGTGVPIGDRAMRRIDRLLGQAGPWVRAAAVLLASWISVDGAVALPVLPDDLGRVALVAASVVAAALPRRLGWPLPVLAAAGWMAYGLWPAVAVASYRVGVGARGRAGIAAYAGAATAAMAASTVVDVVVRGLPFSVAAVVIPFTTLVVLPLVMGLWVSARAQVMIALRERAERLEHEQRARADRARTQERTRIAREMHDIVAHRVSLMVLHAGALEVGTRDERAARAAALIQDIGREALVNLREVLGVLRPPHVGTPGACLMPDPEGDAVPLAPQPMLADLDRLLDQSRSLGIAVERHEEGAARPLPAMVERTAYRLVQEALTNVHKHAGEVSADVVLRYLPGALEVAVRNGLSQVSADPPPGAGLGLTGLRERVTLAGGEFTAGPLPDGGFHVLARLPTDRTEHTGARMQGAGRWSA
ncbi:sensor histidine kinase [Microtetraspora fusca]|uniref:histidine kinase n=1 Tax=Microtetraspora fusca TaxID=1997 RepID=A0ABW6UZW3_MICFU|nr:histidine kinase [Microtetraspora fusca]